MDNHSPPFSWSIRLSLFRNPVLLRQLGLAIGLPFGVMILILALTASEPPYFYYAMGLIGLLFLLSALVLVVVFCGTYDVDYSVSDQGITGRMQEGQAKRAGRINRAAVLLGLFAGNYTVAGAGMLAGARQGQSLTWGRVRKVTYKPRNCRITLHAALGGSLVLFCLPDNYGANEQ
ncbi:MAG: hypothetical protein GX133_12700, partial [Syntrophomonadaceae bacterium]|nr:hypothetical protein [Syntrophomonadaceae bacterium]